MTIHVQVELLLRRCVTDYEDRGGRRRVFCLVNPERLDHKVAVDVTEHIEDMTKTGKINIFA